MTRVSVLEYNPFTPRRYAPTVQFAVESLSSLPWNECPLCVEYTEIARLRRNWSAGSGDDAARRLLGDGAEALDLFERGQLNLVIDVCRRAGSLSAAGRLLFAVSRLQKSQANDADRLRKYLARFGLDWSSVTG